MSDMHCHESHVSDLELEWRVLREAALAARRDCNIVAQRLRAEANLFEIAKERLILEARSLTNLESHRKQRETVAV
jgi:hypothetical protein